MGEIMDGIERTAMDMWEEWQTNFFADRNIPDRLWAALQGSRLSVSKWESERTFNINDRFGELVASFTLAPFSGSWVIISCRAYVVEGFRRCGIGKLLNEFRIKLARRQGAYALLAIVYVFNQAEMRILSANGWSKVGKMGNFTLWQYNIPLVV